MEKMTIKEFKDKSNMEIIKELMKRNNGYITSREIDMYDIHRMYLLIMKERGIIKKVASGVYIDPNIEEDKYYIFGLNLTNIIYSHMTALYFHGLSKKIPNDVYDITVKRAYNNSQLRKHNIFYVRKDKLELGLTLVETPMGNKVKSYDVERSICDIIRTKDRMKLEDIKYSVRKYMKSKDKNLDKLYLYAEKLGVKELVIDFINMVC